MTIEDVGHLLRIGKVPASAYSLIGGLPNEAYCLCAAGTNWEYYYSERGQKSSYKVFNQETEACVYFLNRIAYAFPELNSWR